MKRKEIILFALLLFASLLVWIVFTRIRPDGSYSHIRITIDGDLYGEYPLDKDQVIRIGSTNVCEIKDGQARMTDASCPDHICMQHAPIGSYPDMIVCLPNRVVIESIPDRSGDNMDIPDIVVG